MKLGKSFSDVDLKQDEWSIQKPIFGKIGQLKVIGWSSRRYSAKLYVVLCNVCSNDEELFGGGYFLSSRRHLEEGVYPCGCSKCTRWTKEQYYILCKRKAVELGYTFIGYTGEWCGFKTKLKLECSKHGIWETTNINSFLSKGSGCSLCKSEATMKPDDVIIESFMRSGVFLPETKFWRSLKLDRLGYPSYWNMFCPLCETVGTASSSAFKRGVRPCKCSRLNCTKAYINLILSGNDIIAIKFGITGNFKQRAKHQQKMSIYSVENFGLWEFPDKTHCSKAEQECRQTMECRVLTKEELKDGYTETTWPYNIDEVIKIYERNGGVKIET